MEFSAAFILLGALTREPLLASVRDYCLTNLHFLVTNE